MCSAQDVRMPNDEDAPLLTTREALTRLGYSDPSTISRFVAAGKLTPAKKLPGIRGAYLFAADEIDRFLGTPAAEGGAA